MLFTAVPRRRQTTTRFFSGKLLGRTGKAGHFASLAANEWKKKSRGTEAPFGTTDAAQIEANNHHVSPEHKQWCHHTRKTRRKWNETCYKSQGWLKNMEKSFINSSCKIKSNNLSCVGKFPTVSLTFTLIREKTQRSKRFSGKRILQVERQLLSFYCVLPWLSTPWWRFREATKAQVVVWAEDQLTYIKYVLLHRLSLRLWWFCDLLGHLLAPTRRWVNRLD